MSDDDNTTLSSAESQTPGDFAAPLLHKLGVIARHLIPAVGVLQLGTPVGHFALLTRSTSLSASVASACSTRTSHGARN